MEARECHNEKDISSYWEHNERTAVSHSCQVGRFWDPKSLPYAFDSFSIRSRTSLRAAIATVLSRQSANPLRLFWTCSKQASRLGAAGSSWRSYCALRDLDSLCIALLYFRTRSGERHHDRRQVWLEFTPAVLERVRKRLMRSQNSPCTRSESAVRAAWAQWERITRSILAFESVLESHRERRWLQWERVRGQCGLHFSAFSLRFDENGQSPRAHSGRRPIAGRCDRGITDVPTDSWFVKIHDLYYRC